MKKYILLLLFCHSTAVFAQKEKNAHRSLAHKKLNASFIVKKKKSRTKKQGTKTMEVTKTQKGLGRVNKNNSHP